MKPVLKCRLLKKSVSPEFHLQQQATSRQLQRRHWYPKSACRKERSTKIKTAPGERNSKTQPQTLLMWKQIWLSLEHLFSSSLIPSQNPKSWDKGYLRGGRNVVGHILRKSVSFFSKTGPSQTKITSVYSGGIYSYFLFLHTGLFKFIYKIIPSFLVTSTYSGQKPFHDPVMLCF